MRDERLNRMWSKKKVRFLRPAEDHNHRQPQWDEDEDEDDEGAAPKSWFNIFALHQKQGHREIGNPFLILI